MKAYIITVLAALAVLCNAAFADDAAGPLQRAHDRGIEASKQRGQKQNISYAERVGKQTLQQTAVFNPNTEMVLGKQHNAAAQNAKTGAESNKRPMARSSRNVNLGVAGESVSAGRSVKNRGGGVILKQDENAGGDNKSVYKSSGPVSSSADKTTGADEEQDVEIEEADEDEQDDAPAAPVSRGAPEISVILVDDSTAPVKGN